MPHCIIEYSETLLISPALLNDAAYQALLESELFETSHIKTRASAYADFRLAESQHDFVHVTVRLHRGRTTQQKQMLTKLILQSLQKLPFQNTSLTVEIVDIDSDSYAKVIM